MGIKKHFYVFTLRYHVTAPIVIPIFSRIHWPILVFFYALFVQFSPPYCRHQSSNLFLTNLSLTGNCSMPLLWSSLGFFWWSCSWISICRLCCWFSDLWSLQDGQLSCLVTSLLTHCYGWFCLHIHYPGSFRGLIHLVVYDRLMK